MSNLSMGDAEANRDADMEAADKHADPEWKKLAYAAVRVVCERQHTFISDDVWDICNAAFPDISTHEPRAMSAVLRRSVKNGLCRLESCDHCHTTKVTKLGRRQKGNATDQPIYRSLVCDLWEAKPE